VKTSLHYQNVTMNFW